MKKPILKTYAPKPPLNSVFIHLGKVLCLKMNPKEFVHDTAYSV